MLPPAVNEGTTCYHYHTGGSCEINAPKNRQTVKGLRHVSTERQKPLQSEKKENEKPSGAADS